MSGQRQGPRSVVDPDRDAYERSIRENARLQAERERREAARQSLLDQAADVGGRVVTAIDATAASAQKYARNPKVQRAVKRVIRLGPTGAVISAYEARRQYEKDVAAGMPSDEALVKAAGGLAGAEAGGKLGMAGGAVVGAAGASASSGPATVPVGAAAVGFLGGLAGQDEGEKLGQRLVEPYRGLKGWVKGVTRPLYDPMALYGGMTRGR